MKAEFDGPQPRPVPLGQQHHALSIQVVAGHVQISKAWPVALTQDQELFGFEFAPREAQVLQVCPSAVDEL